jgi:hypothetical protein
MYVKKYTNGFESARSGGICFFLTNERVFLLEFQ